MGQKLHSSESSAARLPVQIAAGVLALSCAYEGMVLAGLETPGNTGYSLYHLLCMGLLLSMSALTFTKARALSANALPIIGLLTVGLLFTGIGDFVNSSISPVESVPQKLKWALLWFGLGYSAYVAFLALEFKKIPPENRKRAVTVLAVAVPVLLIANYLSWSSRVEPLVSPHGILNAGSLVFLLTLYVALPALSLAIFAGSNWSSSALILLIGAGMIPFSDLILFATWLREGEGAVSLHNYALNWMFYFGGQVLFFIGALTHFARAK